MRRAPKPRLRPALWVLALCAGLALCGCDRRQQGQNAEIQDLRERLARLEQDQSAERERLAADVAALRAALDEANRTLAEIQGGEPAPGHPAKSPRAALRESLRGAWDTSRQALDRLSLGLEKSLARPKAKTPQEPAAPAPDGVK